MNANPDGSRVKLQADGVLQNESWPGRGAGGGGGSRRAPPAPAKRTMSLHHRLMEDVLRPPYFCFS